MFFTNLFIIRIIKKQLTPYTIPFNEGNIELITKSNNPFTSINF